MDNPRHLVPILASRLVPLELISLHAPSLGKAGPKFSTRSVDVTKVSIESQTSQHFKIQTDSARKSVDE